jgi:hypothetical protein
MIISLFHYKGRNIDHESSKGQKSNLKTSQGKHLVVGKHIEFAFPSLLKKLKSFVEEISITNGFKNLGALAQLGIVVLCFAMKIIQNKLACTISGCTFIITLT